MTAETADLYVSLVYRDVGAGEQEDIESRLRATQPDSMDVTYEEET